MRDESRKSFKEFHIKFIVVVKFSRSRNIRKLNWDYITRFVSEWGNAFVQWKMNNRVIGKSVINSNLISTMNMYPFKRVYAATILFLAFKESFIFHLKRLFTNCKCDCLLKQSFRINFLHDWFYYSFNTLLFFVDY